MVLNFARFLITIQKIYKSESLVGYRDSFASQLETNEIDITKV